ncbi:hypothetical protein [Chromobacterium sp.]|uniref:hypothetical protein n=1 Tax=Chromobacterium sp. TaxID=306190 RepID=UPI0035B4C5CD
MKIIETLELSNFASQPIEGKCRKNVAGNIVWSDISGPLSGTLGNDKIWIKAVPQDHTYRIANEALAVLLGHAFGAPVLNRAAIVKIQSNSNLYRFIEERRLEPFIWVSPDAGNTLDGNLLKYKISTLAMKDCGIILTLLNSLLNNCDRINILTKGSTSETVIDFDKSFIHQNWITNLEIKKSEDSNWIAPLALGGQSALNLFNENSPKYSKPIIDHIDSIKDDFLQCTSFLKIHPHRAEKLIEHLKDRAINLHLNCSNAIKSHPYFQE